MIETADFSYKGKFKWIMGIKRWESKEDTRDAYLQKLTIQLKNWAEALQILGRSNLLTRADGDKEL